MRYFIFVVYLFGSTFISATTISINNNWTITPQGGSPVNADMPCFYGWNGESDIFIHAGSDEDGWKLFENQYTATYKKVLSVPSFDSDERLFVHFDGVNYLSEIYINQQLVKTHAGGYIPFEADLTDYVSGNGTDTLKVEIKYWDRRFMHYTVEGDPHAVPYWPRGYMGDHWQLGITGDVSLIVRPETFVGDIFVDPSTRNSQVATTVNIANHGSVTKTVRAVAEIRRLGSLVYTLGVQTINVTNGDSASCTITGSFLGATRWSPVNPYIYEMVIRLYQGETLLHTKTQKFGFREFWVDGTTLKLNGVRCNLRGDNIVVDSEDSMFEYYVPDSVSWDACVDSMLALNFNTIRFHQAPPPEYMIRVCDEKGMMVVAESAIYGELPWQNDTFVQNAQKWLREWMIATRNHPSVVMWSAMNEVTAIYQRLTVEQIISLWDIVTETDDSRPFFNEGDWDMTVRGMPLYSFHYPWGWLNPWYPPNGIYAVDQYIHDTKPTSWGEYAWSRGTEIDFTRQDWVRSQGVKTRAARVLDVADIRPYRLDWAWHPNPNFAQGLYGFTPTQAEVEFIKNSMSAVAGFDKDYYLRSYNPSLPSANEYEFLTRNYVFFNDEFSGTDLDVFWCTEYDGEYRDTVSTSITVPLGSHIEQNIQFRAPIVRSTGAFNFHIWIEKSGQNKFHEVVRYRSINNGLSYPASADNIQFQQVGQDLRVSWDPVTQNDEGNPTTINYYAVYRSRNPDFPEQQTDVYSPINNTYYLDTDAGSITDTTLQYFYKIKTVDSRGFTSMSEVYGEFDYHFVTTNTTDFNCVALPFIPGENYTHASDFIDFFPSCNSIAQWVPQDQGFQQYWSGNNSADFEMSAGHVYLVNCTRDTFFTFSGIPASINYNLTTSSPASWNLVMLPFDKYSLEDAADLFQDIPNCDGVALWSNYAQGFVRQYAPQVPQQNFDIYTGYSYWVQVSHNGTWPDQIPQKTVAIEETAHEIKRVKTPHLLYGQPLDMHFDRYIVTNHQTQERLTNESPGCYLNESGWGIQCGNFTSGWQTGDTVSVDFFDTSSQKSLSASYILTSNAFDQVYTSSVDSENLHVAQHFVLNSYPNPFNGELTIQYRLNEASKVRVNVYNAQGQIVQKLIDKIQKAGSYTLRWNSLDVSNNPLPSGVYFIQLNNQQQIHVNKVLLVK